MLAMLLKRIGSLEENPMPLTLSRVPDPRLGSRELLIKVHVCGVCHTELDEIEGRAPPAQLPVILGHQVVGTVADVGKETTLHRIGDRVGVAWIHSTCGTCAFCLRGDVNLCPPVSSDRARREWRIR